jgi:hypothetical protein
MRREVAKRGRDAAIAQIAGSQHGIISTEQLQAIGVSSGGITRRTAAAAAFTASIRACMPSVTRG